jgi:hypothetical protein
MVKSLVTVIIDSLGSTIAINIAFIYCHTAQIKQTRKGAPIVADISTMLLCQYNCHFGVL